MSKYRAVIFDLFGTLVDELRYPEANRLVYQEKADEMADLLGLDRDQFIKEWSSLSGARMVGALSTEAALFHICRRLGAKPPQDRIRASAEVRYSYVHNALNPRPGTVETLSLLRDTGYMVGLISNCSEEVPRLWDSTPFARLVDAAVLSFEVGLAKPDRRIFEAMTERLGVAPRRCLFIGDGSDRELSGASQVGMTAVLMRAPDDQEDGSREGWRGARISDIREVPELI